MKKYLYLLRYNEKTISELFALGISIISVLNVWGESYSIADRIIMLFLILLLIIACLVMHDSCKKHYTIRLDNGKKIRVSFGSIFKKRGVIVIPVNTTFDVRVDNRIVSGNSLHGQFINKYYSKNVASLSYYIAEYLKTRKIGYELSGSKKKYPTGTVVPITVKENTFLLLALTDFDCEDTAHCSKKDYPVILYELFDFIYKNYQDKKIYLPLIGGGLARLNKSPQQILEYLISILKFNDEHLPEHTEIIVHDRKSIIL